MKDKREEKTSYYLKLLEDNWPRPSELKDINDSSMNAVYDVLLDNKYEWRKLSTIVKRTNLSEKRVLDILYALKDMDAVRKSYYVSIDGQEMWGPTSRVGLLPKQK